jgi:tetratricopeptide (TPR) repeat protein
MTASETPRTADRLFSVAEMSRLCGVPVARLRQWDRSGLLTAARPDGGGPRYAFRDVVTARTAAALLTAGVRATQVRRAIQALRAWRPELHAPLASMRVFSEGGQLLVQVDGNVMEPVTGQLLLALPSGELTAVTARPGRRAEPAEAAPLPWSSQAAFEAGLRAEGLDDLATAETHYRAALARDSEHPGALLNLGNIHYNRGEIREALGFYREAVRVADAFPEAHYNLGNALDDLGQLDAAVHAYEAALEQSPDFKAAHFNLALAWEKLGQRERARRHWLAYVRLEPESESAEIARSFLTDDEDAPPESLPGPGAVYLRALPPLADDDAAE